MGKPLLCRLGVHKPENREKNPHRDTDDGYAIVCIRCDALDWNPGSQEDLV